MLDLILDDCMNVMKEYPDDHFNLAVVDPPYGLDKRLSSGGGDNKHTPFRVLYEEKVKSGQNWDFKPGEDYWRELFRVSKNQIVCGANYFFDHLPSTRGIVAWDKLIFAPTMSRFELIWTSFDKPAALYEKASKDLNRFHPTQKPVDLYRFLLDKFAEPGDIILDTHLGSGSIAIACHYLELDLVGIEIDPEYFKKAEKRIIDETSQTTLF